MSKSKQDELYQEAQKQEALAKKVEREEGIREGEKKPEAMAFLEGALRPRQ